MRFPFTHIDNHSRKPLGTVVPVLLGSVIIFLSTVAHASLVKSGFETGEFESYGWRKSGNIPKIVRAPEPVCRGRFAIKFPLNRNNDKVSYRTELALAGNEAGVLKNLKYDEDYWLGMSIFLPLGWKPDEKSIDIMAQLHGVPDLDQGEVYRNPMFNFYVRGNEWFFITKRDSRAVTARSQADMKYEEYGFQSLGKIETGKWTSFVFHFRLSYREGEGRIDVWKNGKKIIDNYKKGVGFNDKTGPYWKIGNYKPAWKPGHEPTAVTHRVHYVDEVAIAMGANRYNDVASSCGKGSAPPPPKADPVPSPPQPAPDPADEPVPPPEPPSEPNVRKPATPVIKSILLK